MEKFRGLGSLKSHLLAFRAPNSKNWSGGWVWRTCSTALWSI